MKLTLLLVLALLVVAVPAFFFFSATNTTIEVNPPVKVIGFATPAQFHLVNPHGVRSFTVAVEQDGKSYSEIPRTMLAGKSADQTNFSLKLGKESVPALHDGKARVIITA